MVSVFSLSRVVRLSYLNFAVLHIEDAIKNVEGAVIVSHDEHSGVSLVSDFREQFHDLSA